MMNIEQLEAMTAELDKSVRANRIADGWRFGKPQENRRSRIKRIRRVPAYYPADLPAPGLEPPDRPCLFHSKQLPRFDVFITRIKRKMPPGLDEPEWVWKDVQSWREIDQFNGYVRFDTKPVKCSGYNDFLIYVPVHGGITYARFVGGSATYGFDTAHADDEHNPLVRNLEWLEYQAWLMGRSIQVAALYEDEYLRSKDAYYRACVIGKYHTKIQNITGQPFDLRNNFGSMINLLSGQL